MNTIRPARGRQHEPDAPAIQTKARLGGAPLRHQGGSWGIREGRGAARANRPGVVEQMLERWFAEAKPGNKLAYRRGSVAIDKVHDPHLARLADLLLELSTGRFDIASECGHI